MACSCPTSLESQDSFRLFHTFSAATVNCVGLCCSKVVTSQWQRQSNGMEARIKQASSIMFFSCILRFFRDSVIPTTISALPSHSLAFFPLLFLLYTFFVPPFLSISTPFLSSPLLLTSLFLTYFLQLLQCSPPCRENIHTHA